ncbi:superkiller protein 3 [Scleroderma citrinum]
MSSPFVKSKLKAARDALGKKQYKAAHEAASQVLDYEPDNYNAHVFLGLAYLELGELNKSEQFYRKAIELKPNQVLAWQGISRLYEKQQQWDAFVDALENIIRIFSASYDAIKSAETLQKLVDTSRQYGSKQQLIHALSYLLPDSPFYDTLSNLPPPDLTNPTATATLATQTAIHNSLPVIEEIVSLTEQSEEGFIKTEFDRRRTRLGASQPEQLKKEIGLEVWRSSKLPLLYQEVLNHPNTPDELRRSTEAKVIRFKQQYFYALPLSDPTKATLGLELDELVNGIVAIGIPDELAWSIFLEGMDKDTIYGRGLHYLRQYVELFPDTRLAQLLKGYFMYTGVPITEEDEDQAEQPTDPQGDDNESFNIIMDAFASLQGSLLATHVAAEVYQQELDYAGVIPVAESGLELIKGHEQHTGRKLREVRKAFNIALATALVHLHPPKHHHRALRILDDVLKQDPSNFDVLLARGYLLQHAEKWEEAEAVFSKAAGLIPMDTLKGVRVTEESSWCLSRTNPEDGLHALKEVLKYLEGAEHELDRARCLWRIGKVCWDLGEDFREEAYTHFIQSLKCDREYAPSYTSLGIYYSAFSIPPDPVRASKCFQKAFELDPREAEAARRLAEGFADEQEWDLVEVVARRTIEGEGELGDGLQKEGGVVSSRYLPTNAWAWKALGVVELSRRNYAQAIEAFQVALRANKEDQICWLRLGEAYSKGGRHAAALKALSYAHNLKPDDWMCMYLIGEVQKHTGKLSDALDSFKLVLDRRPDDVGVLMSIAHTELALARQEWLGAFFARAEQTFSSAIRMSLSTVRASSGYGTVAWKVIADALFGLSKSMTFIDEDVVRNILMQTTSALKGPVSNRIVYFFVCRPIQKDTPITGSHVLEVAVSVCDYRITLGSTDDVAMGSALFDLGLALYLWSSEVKQSHRESALAAAISVLTEALHKEPSNSTYWTTLATMYFVDKPKASQHAYVRALELDPKNVTAWAHLGLLYLYHNDIELANEALLKAQILDPEYTLAWVGQALVATSNRHDEHARALFEHAVGLTADVPMADFEFATRVFQSLSDSAHTSTQEELLSAITVLGRYVKQRPNNASALHLLGLIYERLGQLEQGAQEISRAIVLLEAAYEDTEDPVLERQFTIAHTNLARLKIGLCDYPGALESFETTLGLLPDRSANGNQDPEIQILRVQALFGCGLVDFKLGYLQNAMSAFQAALDAVGDNHVLGAHVTLLLAQSMWAIGTEEFRESAKALLLDSITADPENLMAINTLAGMGILTVDDNLVDAALSEVQSLPIERRQELDPGRDVVYLLVQHHLGQGDIEQAIRIAQKALHVEPSNLHLRRELASLAFQQGSGTNATHAMLGVCPLTCSEDAKETLPLVAITSDGKGTAALKYAQKAIMLDPAKVQNWMVLAYVRARDANLQ